MATGDRIIALREMQNLTQKELAEKLEINRSVLNRIERGTRSVRDDELKKVAAFFNVSTDYLLGRADEAPLQENPDAPWQPRLTAKDERDIQRDLTDILEGLDGNASFAFFNDEQPLSDEGKELLKQSLHEALTIAKMDAKARFTPKKYRK